MKKLLALAASFAVVALSAMNRGDTGILPRSNAYIASEPLYYESEEIGFKEMTELLDRDTETKYESHNPVCFLFGHHLKAGIACLTSYGESADFPECKRIYYEVTYCARCGCYCVTPVSSEHILISPES